MILFILGYLLLFILILAVLIRFTLLVVTIEQTSMSPTLIPGDRVLVAHYWPNHWLHKGQIVLVKPDTSKEEKDTYTKMPYIKRISAIAGDTLITDADNQVQMNNCDKQATSTQERLIWHIPERHIFVQGDNQAKSTDSRSWGPLSFDCISGVMLMRLPRKVAYVPPTTLPTEIFSQEKLPLGEPVPAFTATNLQGETVTLSTYSGHPTLFLFFTPSTSNSLPHREMLTACITRATQLLQREGTVVLVSGATAQRTQVYIEKFAIDLPILAAPRATNTMFADYRIIGMPSYCLIDALGKVQSVGYPDELANLIF